MAAPIGPREQTITFPVERTINLYPWILRNIFSNMSVKERGQCSLVCFQWAVIIEIDPSFSWKT